MKFHQNNQENIHQIMGMTIEISNTIMNNHINTLTQEIEIIVTTFNNHSIKNSNNFKINTKAMMIINQI